MSTFVPDKEVCRSSLIFCYHLDKTASEAHSLLVQAFGDRALGKSQCYAWYEKFEAGNFDKENEPRGRPVRKFSVDDLQKLLDQDNRQTQAELGQQLGFDPGTVSRRLREMGKISKLGRWIPHDLTEQQKNRRVEVCRSLLARQKKKGFLHQIVTNDEKWIYFDNPGRKSSWVDPGEAAATTVKKNRFAKKTMLCLW